MKLKLPNSETIYLLDDISFDNKKNIVKELTERFETEINENWTKNNIVIFLEYLSNYLVWHKEEEEKNKQDKEILSKTKSKRLNKFYKGCKVISFADMTKNEKAWILGEGEWKKERERCFRINENNNDIKPKKKDKHHTKFDKGMHIMAGIKIEKTKWCLVDIHNEFYFNDKKLKIDARVEQYLVSDKSSEVFNYENKAKMEKVLVIKSIDGSMRFFDENYDEINRSLIYVVSDNKNK